MKKQLISLAFGLAALSAQAATPLWLRDVQVSPDGSAIAFGYRLTQAVTEQTSLVRS